MLDQDPDSFFAELTRAAQGREARDVAVLGAGMAGLVAAYELARLGHRVRVYEADRRVGGRIHTKRFSVDGETLHAEVGAMRIPHAHRYTRHYVQELGLGSRLREFATVFQNEDCYLELDGQVCRIRDAVRARVAALRAATGFSPRSPLTLSFATALQILVDAISPGEIRDGFARDLGAGAHARLDRLMDALEPQPSLDDITPRYVVTQLSRVAHLWSPSVATFMRDIGLEAATALSQLDGGMDQLPNELARRLRGELHLGRPVSGILASHAGPRVLFEDGSEIRPDVVVCTIPFTVLRSLRLEGFSAEKMEAIHSLKYHDACKIFLLCRERFWERAPHEIVGGASVSDQRYKQLYYPPRQPLSRGVLLASYVIGDESRALSELGADRLRADMLGMLSRLHPELSAPGMVEEVLSFTWSHQPWMRGGCSVTYRDPSADAAGETSPARLRALHEATVRAEGGVTFAGEHCSDDRAWIEGAVTSALLQVRAIACGVLAPLGPSLAGEDAQVLLRTEARWRELAEGCVRRAAELSRWSRESDALLADALARGPAPRAVLDLGCGVGDPALHLAHRWPSARVLGIDFVPAQVEELARRADALGLRNLEARVADATRLPFASASFDRVSCRFGLQTYPDSVKERILSEAYRVLEEGGRLALVDWGPLGHGVIHSFYQPALEELGLATPPAVGQPALSPEQLATLLTLVGFTDVQATTAQLHWRWPGSACSLWALIVELVPPVRAAVSRLGPAAARELEARVVARLSPYEHDGEVALPAHNVVVSGLRQRARHADFPAA